MPELTVSKRVTFSTAARGRRRLEEAIEPKPTAPPPLPRITRLMALAIKFDGLIASGAITDQAELARAGCITRARATQIMNLLHLAPDIQEQILDLEPVTSGRDPVTERDLRAMVTEANWALQRSLWTQIRGESEPGATLPRTPAR